mgnify:CR=1 FL=1
MHGWETDSVITCTARLSMLPRQKRAYAAVRRNISDDPLDPSSEVDMDEEEPDTAPSSWGCRPGQTRRQGSISLSANPVLGGRGGCPVSSIRSPRTMQRDDEETVLEHDGPPDEETVIECGTIVSSCQQPMMSPKGLPSKFQSNAATARKSAYASFRGGRDSENDQMMPLTPRGDGYDDDSDSQASSSCGQRPPAYPQQDEPAKSNPHSNGFSRQPPTAAQRRTLLSPPPGRTARKTNGPTINGHQLAPGQQRATGDRAVPCTASHRGKPSAPTKGSAVDHGGRLETFRRLLETGAKVTIMFGITAATLSALVRHVVRDLDTQLHKTTHTHIHSLTPAQM